MPDCNDGNSSYPKIQNSCYFYFVAIDFLLFTRSFAAWEMQYAKKELPVQKPQLVK